MDHRPHEVADELGAVLGRDPGLVLIAQDDRGVIGSVFGADDGRRRWLNRLATRPDARGEGVAGALVAALESALRAVGCRKLNLLVTPDNARVVSFYRHHGYAVDELIFMETFLSVPGGERVVDWTPHPTERPTPPGAAPTRRPTAAHTGSSRTTADREWRTVMANNEPFGFDPEDLDRLVRGASEQLRGVFGKITDGSAGAGLSGLSGLSGLFDTGTRRPRPAAEPATTGETGDGVWVIYAVDAAGDARVEQVFASELDALRAHKNNTDSNRTVRFLPYGMPVSVLDGPESTTD